MSESDETYASNFIFCVKLLRFKIKLILKNWSYKLPELVSKLEQRPVQPQALQLRLYTLTVETIAPYIALKN
jgi:hypothetical protein